MRFCWGDEFSLARLVRDIENADFIIAHNAKFELQWLRRCGVDTSKLVIWDTMIGEYVIGGNRWAWAQLSLAKSATRRLGSRPEDQKMDLVGEMFKAGLCSTDVPRSWLKSYCERDTRLARKLFIAQRDYMHEDGQLLPVMYTRCLATPVLAHIEMNGMQLDAEKVSGLIGTKERRYAELQNSIEELTGGININSPKQLAAFLYGGEGADDLPAPSLEFAERTTRRGEPLRTATGKPKTDADTVAALKATNARQREFLAAYKESKELYNELTKYLRKFSACCEEVGGRLQAQFNQCNTRTHRLSSSGLDYATQFQNFPRLYKPIFRARHADSLIGEADGAQLEFRVAAHLGRDEVALDDIKTGTDIHSVTAGIIGCSRQDAKAHTFKPLYGGRSGTRDEVRYYEYFRENYSGITATQQRWIDEVLSSKELRTEWGLKYYWPSTRMERSGYVVNSTSICNYPVQAFATAEIIPVGLVYFWHYVRAAGLQMSVVNTVHDSIITELPPEEVDHFHVLSQLCLIDEVYTYLETVYGIRLTVPLGAGVSVGTHWGDEEAKNNETTYTAQEGTYG